MINKINRNKALTVCVEGQGRGGGWGRVSLVSTNEYSTGQDEVRVKQRLDSAGGGWPWRGQEAGLRERKGLRPGVHAH